MVALCFKMESIPLTGQEIIFDAVTICYSNFIEPCSQFTDYGMGHKRLEVTTQLYQAMGDRSEWSLIKSSLTFTNGNFPTSY